MNRAVCGIVPRGLVSERRSSVGSEDWSGGHGGQLTWLGIAEIGEAFQAQIAPADRPFVGLLEHEGADEADEGGVVGKDADDDDPSGDGSSDWCAEHVRQLGGESPLPSLMAAKG